MKSLPQYGSAGTTVERLALCTELLDLDGDGQVSLGCQTQPWVACGITAWPIFGGVCVMLRHVGMLVVYAR